MEVRGREHPRCACCATARSPSPTLVPCSRLPPTEGDAAADDSGSDSGRKGGGTRRTCTICLDNYVAGDKILLLPCQHRYHKSCISEWLGNRRPVCPVCKADARASSGSGDVEAGSGSGGAQQSNRPFLLRRLGAGWFAVRRHLGGRAAAAAPAPAGPAAGAAAEQEQLLGSRSSTPIPTGNAAAQPSVETAATLLNFPAFFPTSAGSRLGPTSSTPEITPADSTTAEASGPAPAAPPPPRLAVPTERRRLDRVTSPPRSCPPRAARQPTGDSPTTSSAASAAGSQGRRFAGPDSTEGSETESEAE